jgi:streptogramin lyase
MAIACAIAALAGSGPARAATITEFPVEAGAAAGAHKPFWITTAPDGTLWFSDAGTAGGVRQVSLQGEPLEAIPSVSPVDLAFDSSGTLGWAEDSPGSFARRRPSGSVFRVSADAINYAVGLASDGTFRWTGVPSSSPSAKWEVCKDSGGVVCAISPSAPTARLTDLTLGSDGRLWMAAPEVNRIYRLGATGDYIDLAVTLPSGTTPTRIALAPDGNLRVAGYGNDRIYSVTPAGVTTPVQLPGRHGPNDIALAPDGSVWFTEFESNSIGRLTAANQYTSYPVPTPGSRPYALAFGGDGALWFTENGSGKIGRLVPGSDETGTPPTTLEPGPSTPAPAPLPGTGPAAPGAAAFGSRTQVSLKLAVSKTKGAGPISVRIANANSFPVQGTLGGMTTTAVAASRKKVVKLKARRFTVPAGATTTVNLKLPATLKSVLRRSRKLKLKLSASVSDPAGHKRFVTRRVSVKLAR